MSNVFSGPPDARQSDDPQLKVTRFRPRYRALTDEEKALHDEIKAKAEELEALFDRVVPTTAEVVTGVTRRYHALSITALEEAVMWSIKSLTS